MGIHWTLLSKEVTRLDVYARKIIWITVKAERKLRYKVALEGSDYYYFLLLLLITSSSFDYKSKDSQRNSHWHQHIKVSVLGTFVKEEKDGLQIGRQKIKLWVWWVLLPSCFDDDFTGSPRVKIH